MNDAVLAKDVLAVLDLLAGGVHASFRPTHAKGVMCAGSFTPTAEAATLTRAPHATRPSTPVTVRFSDATGLPTIPDNDPARSAPRGCAVRFHLGAHEHTDVVAHARSFDGWRGNVRPEMRRAPAGLSVQPVIARARSWLLTKGWRRHGLLDPTDVPG